MRSFSNYLQEFRIFNILNEDWEEDVRYYVLNDGQGSGRIARQMDELKKMFPNKAGTLYRGLNFITPRQYLDFRRSTKNGKITSEGLSSWSPHFETAQDFAKNRKVYGLTALVANTYDQMQKSRERIMGFIGVVLEIRVPAGIGFDVTASGQGSEDEVLLPKGTYDLVNVHTEKKFQHMLKGIDYNDTVISWTKTNAPMTKEVEWIVANKRDTLYPDTLKMIADKAVAAAVKTLEVGHHFTPHDKEMSRFEHTYLFKGGKLDIWITCDTRLLNLALQLGVKVRFPSSLRASIIRKLNAALAQLKPDIRLMISLESLFEIVCKDLSIRANDIPNLRGYFAGAYKHHDDVVRQMFKDGKHNSQDVRDATREFTKVLECAQMFG